MKNIRHFLAAIVFFLLFLSLPAYGQDNLLNCFDMKLNQVRRDRDKLLIEGTILLEGMRVSSNNQLTVTPVIRATNENVFYLAPIVVNGKSRHKLYNRSLILQGKTTDANVHSVMKANAKYLNRSIPYRAIIAYQPWMKNASMFVVADLCGCGGSNKDHLEKQIGPSIDLGQHAPQANLVVPLHEDLKRRSETGAAYLIFQQSKWDILPALFNNREELDKIDKSLKYIAEEPTATITGIYIKAYASPEGPFDSNLRLSELRAKALLDYIRQKYTLPNNITVFSEGYGEDWDHLVELIKQDPAVENRDQILQIISSVNVFDGREKQIMDLSGGRPYRYMLEKLFPLLRRSVYQIEYAVPEFAMEKAEQILETKPNMLSLEEMYGIADSYVKGSAQYNRVFKIAGQTYPNDPIACVNAAAIAIWEKDFATAKQFIEKWSNHPAAWNNLGIVRMSELRLEDAEQYLLNAKAEGISEAIVNLEILKQLKTTVQVFEGLGD